MQPTTRIRPAPLDLFADRTSPRLYDRIVEVPRGRHYSRRTEDACRDYTNQSKNKLAGHSLIQGNKGKSKFMKTIPAKTLVGTTLVFAFLPLVSARADIGVTSAEIEAIAEEGFIYGLPIVMNYGVMNEYVINRDSGQFKAPFNHIKNEARVFTYKDTAIITPNSDTPYSLLWLDLRAEPIVLSVPAVDKSRYYSVMLEDGNTFIYGYIGSRATGSEAGDYMVVGPGWKGKIPDGIKKVFHSSTQFSLVAYRTQLFNPEDMPNVVKIQSGYGVKPLSEFLGQPAPSPAPKIDFPKFDKEMVKTKFFDYLEFSLQFALPVRRKKKFARSSPRSELARTRPSISMNSLQSKRRRWLQA